MTASNVKIDVLPDLLVPGLDVVFCGTAVGRKSAFRGAYYAGPGNVFWQTLHEVGLTPVRLRPDEYPRLIEYGIGLTDLAKRISGSDKSLSPSDFSRKELLEKLRHFQPRIIAFTGKYAASAFLGASVEYGRLRATVENVVVFVLSSPSGLAKKYWSPRYWRDLAELVRSRGTGE